MRDMSNKSEKAKMAAERLGSAAKFAITKEQIRNASREELRSIEQRLMALAKSGDKNAAALLDYVEEEYNERYRGTHARPGAKAKMGFVGTAGRAGAMAARGMQDGAAAYRAGKPAVLNRLDPKYRNWSDKDLEVYGNFWMRGWTGEQMKDMTIRDPKRGTDLPGSRFSRPGAKAKMAKTFSGKTFKLNTGTVVAAWDDGSPAQFMNVAQAKAFAEKHGLGDVIKGRGTGFFILPEKDTSSRPGAKAAMAIRSDDDVFNVLTEASDKGLDRHNLVREARRLRDAIDPHGVGGQAMLKHKSWPQLVRLAEQIERLPAAYARPGAKVTAGRAEDLYRKLSSGSITYANAKEWERLVTEALRLPDYTPPGGDMSLHEIAEDLGGDLMALKTHSGPVPHAKAKAEKATMAASTPHKVTVTDKSGTARTYMVSDRVLRSIEGTKKQAEARGTAPAYDDVIRLGTKMGEVVEASKAKAEKPSDLEREDVKAGLKLMEKADPAVSDKIRTLIAEGKPQDQAVAIALDMKRRGEI